MTIQSPSCGQLFLLVVLDELDDGCIAEQGTSVQIDDVNHEEIAHDMCIAKANEFTRSCGSASWNGVSRRQPTRQT
jgi:hypothetical protein